VQTLIWALRREFKSCDFEDRNEVLLTRAPGYVLADSVAVDLAEFKELTRRGKVALASGEARPASQCFGAALGLWRGHPFADVSSAYISAAAEGIQELHVLALEAKADADLALGDYDSVVTQVSQWLPSYPLRERLRALCMLAMYRLGCRADALNLYRSGREAIVDALGLEPTAELRTLQQRIIADDPALVSRSQRALGGRAASM
jgi:DNA-binding SARP family transcriptional activator